MKTNCNRNGFDAMMYAIYNILKVASVLMMGNWLF